jgi:hypothetical protein
MIKITYPTGKLTVNNLSLCTESFSSGYLVETHSRVNVPYILELVRPQILVYCNTVLCCHRPICLFVPGLEMFGRESADNVDTIPVLVHATVVSCACERYSTARTTECDVPLHGCYFRFSDISRGLGRSQFLRTRSRRH